MFTLIEHIGQAHADGNEVSGFFLPTNVLHTYKSSYLHNIYQDAINYEQKNFFVKYAQKIIAHTTSLTTTHPK